MSTTERSTVLLSRIARLPASPDGAVPGGEGAPGGPRAAVADLALDGCLLGTYAGAYPAAGGWWEHALDAVARYAGVPAPAWRPENVDLDLERHPFHDDSPVAEAVLRLVRAGGLRALTLERVARASGRDPDWIVSMHGSVEGLVDALVERVGEEAFDDLVPVHATEPSVATTLAAFASSHRVVAMLRLLALTGVEVPDDAADEVRRLSPVARDLDAPDGTGGAVGTDDAGEVGTPRPGIPDGALVATLAVDAWRLGSATSGYGWPTALTPEVVAELRRLAAA